MQASVIVIVNEPSDGPFELPRAVVLLELHDVLHRAVIAFDLALRHRVIRCPPRTRDLMGLEIVRELARHVARPVVAQEPRPMHHPDPVGARLARARSSVSITSAACIDVRSSQAMMYRA